MRIDNLINPKSAKKEDELTFPKAQAIYNFGYDYYCAIRDNNYEGMDRLTICKLLEMIDKRELYLGDVIISENVDSFPMEINHPPFFNYALRSEYDKQFRVEESETNELSHGQIMFSLKNKMLIAPDDKTIRITGETANTLAGIIYKMEEMLKQNGLPFDLDGYR